MATTTSPNTKVARLTKFQIDHLAPGKNEKGEAIKAFLRDTEVPGLAVRCTPAGAKSFVFQARLRGGGTVYETLGSVDDHPIDNPNDPDRPGARQWARGLRQLIDHGTAPKELREKKQKVRDQADAEEQRRTMLVRTAWDDYVAFPRQKAWSPRHLADHIRLAAPGGEVVKRGKKLGKNGEKPLTIPGPLAPLMDMRLADITDEVMADWLRSEAVDKARPQSTRLAFTLFRAFLRWASERKPYDGIADANVTRKRTVTDEVPRTTVRKNKLASAQLEDWFLAVEALKGQNATPKAFLQALLLTGARSEELERVEWAHINTKYGRLRIEHGKTGARDIPLTPYVEHLIGSLPRLDKKEFPEASRYVFASKRSATGHITAPNIALNTACAAVGIKGIAPHDLRKTYATLAEETNPPDGVIKQIQGHAPTGVAERNYKMRDVDQLRPWAEKIEAWFLDQAGIEYVPAPKQAAPEAQKRQKRTVHAKGVTQ